VSLCLGGATGPGQSPCSLGCCCAACQRPHLLAGLLDALNVPDQALVHDALLRVLVVLRLAVGGHVGAARTPQGRVQLPVVLPVCAKGKGPWQT